MNVTVTSRGGTVNAGTETFTVKDAGSNTIGTPVTSAMVTGSNASATFTIPAGQAAGSH